MRGLEMALPGSWRADDGNVGHRRVLNMLVHLPSTAVHRLVLDVGLQREGFDLRVTLAAGDDDEGDEGDEDNTSSYGPSNNRT